MLGLYRFSFSLLSLLFHFLFYLPMVHLRHVGRQVSVLRQLYEVADRDGRGRQVGRRQGAAGGEASRRGAGEARGLFQRRAQRWDGRLLLRCGL